MLVLDRIQRRRPRIATREARTAQLPVDFQADVHSGGHRLAVELPKRPGLVERKILLQRRQRLGRFVFFALRTLLPGSVDRGGEAQGCGDASNNRECFQHVCSTSISGGDGPSLKNYLALGGAPGKRSCDTRASIFCGESHSLPLEIAPWKQKLLGLRPRASPRRRSQCLGRKPSYRSPQRM